MVTAVELVPVVTPVSTFAAAVSVLEYVFPNESLEKYVPVDAIPKFPR
jgi:hypothetical protein